MRRNARRSERRGLARDGGITLRRALGIAFAIAAGWLLLAGPLSPAPSVARADTPTPTPTATGTPAPTSTPRPSTPTPTSSFCFFCTSTPTGVGPTFGTAPPTATPVPTATPSPTPTAAPTTVPTKYAESIDPQQTQASIPPTNANLTVVPHPHGGGSPLVDWLLLAIGVFAVLAGTSFFLFFKIR
ncbi:MAG: hypothetical protein ABR950_01505 [Candidatus Dormibacteria bacterium]